MDNELRSTRNRKGWLLPYLITLDDMYFKRWHYWSEACLNNKIPEDPIPNIPFKAPHEYKEQQVPKNLKACLDYPRELSNPLEAFIDWLLWGFNTGDTFPTISESTDNFWYRKYNLGLFYLEPADHWSTFASDYLGKNNRLGYFGTPGSVVDLMVRMNFGSDPKHEHKTLSVCDPCSGTGIMLMFASNYSLNLYGVDISLLLVKICKVNAFIYMPWMVYKPKHLTIFDKPKENCIIEIDLPSGVRIPQCSRCNGKSDAFYMDIRTDHQLSVSETGLCTVDDPTISTDLVKNGIKLNNLHCAHCTKEG